MDPSHFLKKKYYYIFFIKFLLVINKLFALLQLHAAILFYFYLFIGHISL